MACECLEKCPFFNDKMADMPSMSDLLKDRYCRGEWRSCARYRVFEVVGRESVPPDLYPAQADKVDGIIAAISA
jgi:hypothetical protein